MQWSKGKKYKQRAIKHDTETKRSSTINPT